MKPKINFLVMLLSIITCGAFSQTTIVIQPDSVQGVDAYISDWPTGNYQNTNFGNLNDFDGVAWTAGGVSYTSRSLINFSLSSIPPNAIITHAQLSLYHNTNSNQSGSMHQSLSGPNDSRIERVTSPWSENTVTWNTQPTTTLTNAVYLPPSTSGTQDYLNIDVTGLVTDIFTNPSSSYGMMLRLNDETQYRSVIFCSTDDPNILKHPKLEITYVDSATCISMQPDSAEGIDAYISDWAPGNYANLNFGSYPDYDGIAWTDGGDPYIGRSLLQFDFSAIPANATIISALISLYNNPTSFQTGGQHYSLTGSNDGSLERITSYWDENTVTWNTQPTTTTLNSVFLAQASTPHQDYTNVDVKNLVVDMINNPATSFGFMLRLNTEQTYRSLVFASSDNIDSTKHPKIEICYTVPTSIHKNEIMENELAIIPNPFTDQIKLMLNLNKSSEIKFSITDVAGRTLLNKLFQQLAGKSVVNISDDLSDLKPGVYVGQFSINGKITSRKIIKN